ncbi:glycosyltransferase family 2 protein [Microbacterium sp. NPDC058062]|uniref:glycosyltransferase family 2 protein n=1 Tax=Microbacterium sp. NPDC058062 TaxID=3346320 RepID=UPI0036D878A2
MTEQVRAQAVPHGGRDTPQVSVVIPTHNRPQLMKLAVESVLSQRAPVTGEVIIVFDACSVDVPEVALPAGWSLRGVPNSRTRGLAGARNSGISDARGDYVAFLDDDDVWLPGKLAAQIDRFAESPEAVVVGTAMVVDNGTEDVVRLAPSENLTHEDFLRNRNPGVHSSSLLFRRADLLGPLGLIDEELPRSYGEDYDILLRASALGAVTVVNRPLVRVLWNGQSYYFGQWAAYAEALQYLLRKHGDFATTPGAIGRIEAQVAFALASSRQGRDARRWARRAISNDPRQIKAYLAIAISLRLLTPAAVTRIAQRFGRGI